MRYFCLRTALNAISKNKMIYIPYLFVSSFMGMIIYFMVALSMDESIAAIGGGDIFVMIVSNGMVVFAMLTIAFMFYLCFFITGKRKREYGLLTVLGLEHKHLVRLVFLENSILFFLNIIFSSLGGVVFYKLVQLAFIRILEGPIDHDITLCPEGLLALVTLYFIVYLIIFLFQVIRIVRNKPLELMRSKRVRDRFTKIDMLLAIMGILLMGLSYTLSFSIPESVDVAKFEFQTVKFITAVIFAVISTFLLFSSGSALILTLIRRKRGMYLGRIGFITISTLYSRMRRNGIGLAVVSMLCSLVMIFTSALLTFFISIDEYLSNMGPITYEVVGDTALQEFTVNINDDIPGDLRIVSTSAYEPVYVKKHGTYIKEEADIENMKFELPALTMIDMHKASSVLGLKAELSSNEVGIILTDQSQQFEFGDLKSFVDNGGNKFNIVLMEIHPHPDDPIDLLISEGPLIVYPGDEDQMLDHYLDTRPVNYFFKDGIREPERSIKSVEELKAEKKEELKSVNLYAVSLVTEKFSDQVDLYNNVKSSPISGFVNVLYSDSVQLLSGFRALIFICMMFILIFVVMIAMILYYRNLFDGLDDADSFELMRKVGLENSLIGKVVYIQMFLSLLWPVVFASLSAAFGERFVICFFKTFDIVSGSPYLRLVLISVSVAFLIYAVVAVIAGHAYSKVVMGKMSKGTKKIF